MQKPDPDKPTDSNYMWIDIVNNNSNNNNNNNNWREIKKQNKFR